MMDGLEIVAGTYIRNTYIFLNAKKSQIWIHLRTCTLASARYISACTCMRGNRVKKFQKTWHYFCTHSIKGHSSIFHIFCRSCLSKQYSSRCKSTTSCFPLWCAKCVSRSKCFIAFYCYLMPMTIMKIL